MFLRFIILSEQSEVNEWLDMLGFTKVASTEEMSADETDSSKLEEKTMRIRVTESQ